MQPKITPPTDITILASISSIGLKAVSCSMIAFHNHPSPWKYCISSQVESWEKERKAVSLGLVQLFLISGKDFSFAFTKVEFTPLQKQNKTFLEGGECESLTPQQNKQTKVQVSPCSTCNRGRETEKEQNSLNTNDCCCHSLHTKVKTVCQL